MVNNELEHHKLALRPSMRKFGSVHYSLEVIFSVLVALLNLTRLLLGVTIRHFISTGRLLLCYQQCV